MNNVTRFPGGRPCQALTSGHRFLMYAIMDLCIDISQRTEHKATFHVAGHVHTLSVDITPPEHLAVRKGGDGSHTRCWEAEVHLPPNPLAGPASLQELSDIITALQVYLPEGAA
jgi:hypothetical protein